MSETPADTTDHGLPPDLDALITSEAPRDRAEPLRAFAKAYLRRVPVAQAEELGPEGLYAQISSLFEFASSRGTEPQAIRIFNPDPAVHGYATGGTVVEVVIDDMPFLIDSLTAAIHRHGCDVEFINHPVVGTIRDADGRLVMVRGARDTDHRESIQHFELDRRLSSDAIDELGKSLHRVLDDVRRAVRDFLPMQQAVDRLIDMARAGRARYDEEEVEETVAFLEWLRDLNFVFLGYREYEIIDAQEGPALQVTPGTGLGILSDAGRSAYRRPVPMSELPEDLRARYETGDLVVITKTNSTSTVHRPAKMDYIGVRNVASDGSVVGEGRLLGLFTSKAYMTPAASIPLLRRKLEQILVAEDLIEGSHDHKLVIQIFESFPKDELFATPTDEIRRIIAGLVESEEREHVRLFVRPDLLHRSVAILVVLPRDLFNAELRKKLQELFVERYGGTSVDYRLSLGEAGAARLHFTVWMEGGQVPDVPFDELEAEVLDLCRTWKDRLRELLAARTDPQRATELVERWADRFPPYYVSATSLEVAAGDIIALDRLDPGERRVTIGIQNEPEPEDPSRDRLTRIAVYRLDGKLDLSAIMPRIEAFGFRVVEEVPTRLLGDGGHTFIHDFGIVGTDGAPLDLDRCGDRLAEALDAVLRGATESDSLHRLIVSTPLDYRQIEILRAYRTYWRLVSPAFTSQYMNDALASYPEIATRLVEVFEQKFDPEVEDHGVAPLAADVTAMLEEVDSLDHDRILRGFLGLIVATTRTNRYRPDRHSLSFKLRSAEVPEMLRPHPLFEIFVFAPDVEGIHLRGGMVARGGIRWSDRLEDYRTEVLGLMKAQMTKNAIIVPTGSKGGFIVRDLPPTREEQDEAVRHAYITFIRGLLDVTDNLVAGQVEHPRHVVVHDGDDAYLVVAADKGTARLSDTANAVAAEYGFWLGDAFASGGSAGYDHKALGITARGAWESVRRHFREIGIDDATTPFTVVGIGDMSGDVFGNGMLLSRQIRLVAAFDHRHVFVDPDPDPATSYEERERLFQLPGSSWDDYDRAKISAGGGVFSRRAKRIDVSPEMQRALGIDVDGLTPNELISAALRAPVDLLWNGGIGTYVKSSDENNADVGDRSNDAVRVNASELRCRVVGEGGNLGFTQWGRIEFAAAGGMIYTDFIDNAGGVHTSDREVNLKILLNSAIEQGALDAADRDDIVRSVADDVVGKVVYENFLQAQILAQEAAAAPGRLEAYADLIEILEHEGTLDRTIEHLPDAEEFVERIRAGRGLYRPELAVLLAYAKRRLSEALIDSELPTWGYFDDDLLQYFPEEVAERFGALILDHPLRRELVATIVANQIVDSQGISFVSRLETELGVPPSDVVRAYRIARDITGAEERWDDIEALDGKLDPELQRSLMEGVDHLVESTARWYLARLSTEWIQHAVAAARAGYDELTSTIATVGPEEWRAAHDERVEALLLDGVPPEIARRHVYQEELVHAPDIIEVARAADRSVTEVARVFFLVGIVFHLDELERFVEALPAGNRWQRLAAQTLGDDLLLLRRQIAERVISDGGTLPPDVAVGAYLGGRPGADDRLGRLIRNLQREPATDAAAIVVAIRQIRSLAT